MGTSVGNVNTPKPGSAYWVVGDTYTIQLTGAETGGAMMMLHAEVPPGAGPPPHVHTREDEIFYVLTGELSLLLDGNVSKAGPGTTVFLPRNVKHTFWNESDAVTTMLIMATPAGIENYFAEVGVPVEEGSAAPEMTPEAIAHLFEAAGRYGMTIDPPPAG